MLAYTVCQWFPVYDCAGTSNGVFICNSHTQNIRNLCATVILLYVSAKVCNILICQHKVKKQPNSYEIFQLNTLFEICHRILPELPVDSRSTLLCREGDNKVKAGYHFFLSDTIRKMLISKCCGGEENIFYTIQSWRGKDFY